MKINNKIKTITIGSFDGLHLAHQQLISQAEMVVAIERSSGYLTPGYKRSWYTGKPITIYQFDKINGLGPEEFIDQLKSDFPALEKIIIGYDFHFGKDKSGNAETLQQLFRGEVVIVKQICLGGVPVHSRTIKQMIMDGEINGANKLLGRNYIIDGETIKGQGIGSNSLVPTLNLKVKSFLLPMDGVYATKTKIDGLWYASVSFLGHRVTTDGSFAVETHIINNDIQNNINSVEIEFIDRIRGNKKFEDLKALKSQIKQDINIAKGILS